MPRRARLPAAQPPSHAPGGFTFAEDPARIAPEARIIWHAALDPGTLAVGAVRAAPDDPECLSLDRVVPWLQAAVDRHGYEHVVLSDGRHRIRLDVVYGRLVGQTAVRLEFRLQGLIAAQAGALSLRRLIHLHRYRRFARSLFPRDPWIDRGIVLLRVHDALALGASQRDLGEVLFGSRRVSESWNGRSDWLRSRVRRLVREARGLAQGGYRRLLLRRPD